MWRAGSSGSAILALLAVGACATAPVRHPVTDVPLGTYVLVEPDPGVYNAVTINERAWAVREGNEVFTGTQWVDDEGRLHLVDDAGPCAGVESIWTYSYANRRITLERITDMCSARSMDMPARMVYEQRP